ncbi:MAG: helix-turn-helix domain-containing protein [Actinomycetota bacterium]
MPSGEQESAGARRRALIVEVARREFRRTGLSGTSLGAIADAANVRRPHLYRYFADKADLVAAVAAAETQAINAQRSAALAGVEDIGEQIVRSLELAVELVDGDPFWTSLVEPGNVPYTAYAATRDPELLASNTAFWAPVLGAARAAGRLRSDVTDDEIMTWLLGLQFLFLERREIFPAAAEIRRYTEAFVVPAFVID